jgi:hypothetical protein
MWEMAYAFAEEFAALGFGEERLFNLFRQPFYVGPHQAYKVLGEEAIRRVIRESVGLWSEYRVVVREPERPAGEEDSELVQLGRGSGQWD